MITERSADDVRRCAWQRDDEMSSWCEVSVCDSPHTQNCVQLVCCQGAVCQVYGSLSDRSQQKQQQHADCHIGYCHLQKVLHWHVQMLTIRPTCKLNNALINKLLLEVIANCYSVDWWNCRTNIFLQVKFVIPRVDVEIFVPSDVSLQVCTTSHHTENSHHSEWQQRHKFQRCCDLPNLSVCILRC